MKLCKRARINYYLLLLLLPSANEVCEGYVFTPVCQSFCSQGVCLSACWDTPQDQAPPRADIPPGPGTPQSRQPPRTRHPPRTRNTTPQSRQPPGADTPPGADNPPGAETATAIKIFPTAIKSNKPIISRRHFIKEQRGFLLI